MLNRRIIRVAFIVALAGTFGCQSSSSDDPLSGDAQTVASSTPSMAEAEAIKQSREAAETWLKQIDQGKYGDGWEQMGKVVTGNKDKEAWCKQTGAIRNALGSVRARNLKVAKYETELSGAPSGDYVKLTYDTVFTATSSGIEEVTEARDKDGSWKAIGYYVSLKPQPTFQSTPPPSRP